MGTLVRWHIPNLSDRLFEEFAAVIYEVSGIRLLKTKKTMLISRLVGRLRALSLDSFETYYTRVTSDQGELVHMIDAVSTNKTEFFREDSHFSFLTGYIVPMLHREKITTDNKLHIWSAGCSSGEEPYTMGMVLAEYTREHRWFDFEIFATDISTKILAMAKEGIYKDEKIAHIPKNLVERYLLRGRGEQQGQHRVVPELQEKITFAQLNFTLARFPFDTLFDVIFCRNVMIYFDRKTQGELFAKFHDHLKPGGYFFLGHSEMMANVNHGFEKIEPTVYRKK